MLSLVKNRIFTELRIGQKDDGIIMEGKARELLKAVDLKPLRDAEREMSSGRNSRISQILMSHPVFSDRDGRRLKGILSNANNDIEKIFYRRRWKSNFADNLKYAFCFKLTGSIR